jgi:hypothetical protein
MAPKLFFGYIQERRISMQHVGRSTTTLSGISSSYASSLEVELKVSPRQAVFVGKISIINIQLSNLSASSTPTKLTLKISEDALGDEYLLTGTTSDIELGETTATKGTAIWKMDGIVALDLGLNDEVYCWVKTNHGPADISQITITWEGDR